MGMTIPAVQKAVSEGKANQTRGSPEASLSNTRDGKNGWGKKFGTAQEALNDAIQSVDTKLWNSFNKEFDSNTTNHPVTNAINAVMQDVRQDTITPMQGAMLLSQTYQDGGVDALSKLYNHKTGNLHDNVLDEAKQIGEGKASRENNDEKYNNFVVKSSNKNGENYGLKLRTYSLDEIAQLYDKADYGAEYDVLFNKVYEFCKNMNIVFSVEPEIVNVKGNQIAGQSIGDKS